MIPSAIRDDVRAFVRANALLRPGPIVVAVSGGTDSTALLLLLADLREEQGLVLHVAHFDHRTRPRDAAREAQHVAELAARCGASFRAGRAERVVRSEDDARTARYAFLRRAAAAVGATAIATGHTRDDQAETVLLHLVRGSGLEGLAAMRPERDGIVRPLLTVGRAETAAVCAALGITPLEDSSNRSLRFARNRVRLKVMPELTRINPRASHALARAADSAAADEGALREAAARIVEQALVGDALQLEALDLQPELRERSLALVWARWGGGSLDARHRKALADLAARRDGSAGIDLPGGTALREYGVLRFVERERAVPEQTQAPDGHPAALALGEVTCWRDWRVLLSAGDEPHYRFVTGIAAEHLEGLTLRSRRPGDRLAGRKVQDILVDAKVPAAVRDRQPLLVDSSGAVLWVVGVAGGNAVTGGRMRVHAQPPGGSDANGFWSSHVPGNRIG